MVNVIVLTDGLGNQMFQYALYLAMRTRGKKVCLNTSVISRKIIHNGFELCRDFNIARNSMRIIDGGWLIGGMTIFATRYVKRLCYIEKEGVFSDSVFRTNKMVVYGYWQDIRYFKGVENEIRNAFTFRNIDETNLRQADEMRDCKSISIHIRRGDYLKYPQYQICTPEYYKQAISIIKEHVDNPMFYIFSDDLEWSEMFIKEQDVNYKLIRHNRGIDSYKDMYLMTQCKHNIIANSSFSWWGAWLGIQEGRMVICPSKWNLESEKIRPQLDSWKKI